MRYDEEKTEMDGGRLMRPSGASSAELQKVDQTIEMLREKVSNLEARVLVLEKIEDKDATAKVRTGPTKSEILSAVSSAQLPRPEEKKNDTLEVLKTVGPWIMAILAILSTVVQSLVSLAVQH